MSILQEKYLMVPSTSWVLWDNRWCHVAQRPFSLRNISMTHISSSVSSDPQPRFLACYPLAGKRPTSPAPSPSAPCRVHFFAPTQNTAQPSSSSFLLIIFSQKFFLGWGDTQKPPLAPDTTGLPSYFSLARPYFPRKYPPPTSDFQPWTTPSLPAANPFSLQLNYLLKLHQVSNYKANWVV